MCVSTVTCGVCVVVVGGCVGVHICLALCVKNEPLD